MLTTLSIQYTVCIYGMLWYNMYNTDGSYCCYNKI